MASKLVAASHSHIFSSIYYPKKSKTKSSEIRQQHYQQTWWVGRGLLGPSRPNRRRRRRGVVLGLGVSILEDPFSVYSSCLDAPAAAITLHNPIISYPFLLLADTSTSGYSLASYYTSLGLFVISVPGLWSLIKRSVKSKVVQKTFIADGQGKGEGRKEPNQLAGEILSFFTRNNFVVCDRGETITFEGMMMPSRGQAALLTFCTCISLASVALVLTITVPDVGNNWFWLTILSPLAGAYYWKRASRKEQIKVKMMVGEDGNLSEIVVQGDDQQVDQMRKELLLSEKGMVYVKGIFER